MNEMTRIASAPAHSFKARFSAEEYLRMVQMGAFGDAKVELVDGELERMPPSQNEHGRRQMMIGIRLSPFIAEELLRGEIAIDVGGDTVLGCDAAVLISPVIGNRVVHASEVLLVIEIAETTLARDTGMKRMRYAAAGIAHYWVVDGERSVVHVHTDPAAGDYAEISTVRFGQPLPVPGADATITLD